MLCSPLRIATVLVCLLLSSRAYAEPLPANGAPLGTASTCTPLDPRALEAERQHYQARLDQLHARRAELKIAPPILATVGGYTLSYGLLLSAFMVDPGRISPGLLAGAAAPMALGVAGNVWLVRQLRARGWNRLQYLQTEHGLAANTIQRARVALDPQACATELDAELARVDARLTLLMSRRQTYELSAPASMAILGFGFALASAGTAVLYGFGATVYGSVTIPQYHHVLWGLLGVGGSGLVLGVSGGIWLLTRKQLRDADRGELKALQQRRQQLMPRFSPQFGARHVGVVLSWTWDGGT